MPSLSRHLLARLFPRANFAKDSIWSVPIVVGGFVSMFLLMGINHSLGSFFEIWRREFSTTDSTLIWVQSLGFGFNFLSPLHAVVLRKFSGQIVLALTGVVLAATYTTASLGASSAAGVVGLLGFVPFVCAGSVMLFVMNLIGRATDKYRALAYAVSNCGAPVGMMVFPLIVGSVTSSYGWKSSILFLGLLWLFISAFTFFLFELDEISVEINHDDHNNRTHYKNTTPGDGKDVRNHSPNFQLTSNQFPDIPPSYESVEEKIPLPRLDKTKGYSSFSSSSSSSSLLSSLLTFKRLFKRRLFLLFLVYGFCESVGMFGMRVFLSPLLSESFGNCSAQADDPVPSEITTALSFYGVGGIIGVLAFGPLMSWGPLVNRKLIVFIIISILILIITILFIFVVESFTGISLLVASLGFCHQGWYGVIWVVIYELFDSSEVDHAHSNDQDNNNSNNNNNHNNRHLTTFVSSVFWGVNSISALATPAALSALLSAFDDDAACGTESTPRFHRRPSSVAGVAMVASVCLLSSLVQIFLILEKKRERERRRIGIVE